MIFNVQDYSVKTNSNAVQTKELQKVFDLCKAQGGTIVFPKGEYYTGSLYVYANTTIHLEKGAVLYGSDNMDDFILYDIPAGMEVHTDKEVLPDGLFGNGPKYRCAVLNAYGEDNITIEGEGVTSIMNGMDVYDENGEEGFRGPHGVFFTHCDNIVIKNYVTARFGNFHYHFDCCHHIPPPPSKSMRVSGKALWKPSSPPSPPLTKPNKITQKTKKQIITKKESQSWLSFLFFFISD